MADTEKSLFQNFSEFKGLDIRSSDLSRSRGASKDIKNFTLETDFTLGGFQGLKTFADDMAGDGVGPAYAYHNYRYKDPKTGEDKEELICLSDHLYRLRQDTFTITYSGGGAYWGYSFLLEPADNEFHLRLDTPVVQALNVSIINKGLENYSTGRTTLGQVKTLINAVPGFAASASASVDNILATTLPLYRDLNITASSLTFPVWYWEKVVAAPYSGAEGIFGIYQRVHHKLTAKPPTFVNKNNVCYIAFGGQLPLMKYDGQSVHQAGGVPLTENDIAIGTTASTPALVGSFRYYIRYVTRDAKGNFIYGTGVKTGIVTATSGEAPFFQFYVRASTFLGVSSSGLFPIGEDTTIPSPTNTITLNTYYGDNVLVSRYGATAIKAGDFVLVLQGSNLLPRRVVSFNRATKDLTLDGAPLSTNAIVYWTEGGFDRRVIFTNAAATGSTFSYVTNAGIVVGDFVYFELNDVWLEVIEINTGSSTFTVDGVASLPSGSSAVTTTILEMYRTENEGAEKFYRVGTYPWTKVLTSFHETTTGVNLKEEVIIPNNEPDHLREYPVAITEHQDLLVTGGGKEFPSRIRFEDIEYKEAFPLATNFYDIVSNDSGGITAFSSDGFDQLGVFKDNAYYSVLGSFRDEIPTLTTIVNTEQDIGISCQNSIVKVRGLNIGVSRLGLVAFKSGVIDYEFTKQLDSDFLVNTVGKSIPLNQRFYTEKAFAVNDKIKQQALFFIPAYDVDGDEHRGANGNSRIFVLDYSEQAWLKRTFPSDLSVGGSGLIPYPFYPSAGMVIFENQLTFGSIAYDSTLPGANWLKFSSFFFMRKEKEGIITTAPDYRYDYADQHVPIEYDMKSQWYFGLTPLTDKLFQWLKVYSLNTLNYTPFDLRIRTYLDWDESQAIDDQTVQFDVNTPYHLVKLQANRGSALMVRFTVNALHTKPTITGYELIPAEVDRRMEGIR
jgi:hypothetical protein